MFDIDTFLKGAGVGIIGTITAFVLKEYAFPRLFEVWKAHQTLQSIYRKYRDPLFLSSVELASRLRQICRDYPTNFLSSELRAIEISKFQANSIDDPYYRKHKQISTIYRFCAFLGWLELYRQEIVFLDSGHIRQNTIFEHSLAEIRSDLADGHINTASDWPQWDDYLIFREELRAIGEAMITEDGKFRNVVGYKQFCEFFLHNTDKGRSKWLETAAFFFLDVPVNSEKNFRLVRFKRLFVHLVDLVEVLDSKRVSSTLIQYRSQLKCELTT